MNIIIEQPMYHYKDLAMENSSLSDSDIEDQYYIKNDLNSDFYESKTEDENWK